MQLLMIERFTLNGEIATLDFSSFLRLVDVLYLVNMFSFC